MRMTDTSLCEKNAVAIDFAMHEYSVMTSIVSKLNDYTNSSDILTKRKRDGGFSCLQFEYVLSRQVRAANLYHIAPLPYWQADQT